MLWLIPVVFGSVLVLFALSVAFTGLVRLRRWWTMRRLDPTEMGAEPGLQEFEGTARAVAGTVQAPFTGAEALVCDWSVERYSPSGEGSNWDTVDGGTETVAFELEHAGPTVAVDPDTAQLIFDDTFLFDARDGSDLPKRIEQYRDEHAGDTIEAGMVDHYKFVERRLEPGDYCYVVGPAERAVADPPGGSRARLSIAPDAGSWFDELLRDPFVVADNGERSAQQRQLGRGLTHFVLGLFVLGLLGFLLWMAI